MKNYNNLLLILVLTITFNVFGQKRSFYIGESTTNKLTKNKPAQILATFPRNDSIDNSWLVNGYFEFKFNWNEEALSFGILTEIHKNNLITKEQDIRQLGVSLEKDFTIFKRTKDTDENIEKLTHSRFITNATLKYSNNLIKEEKALIANFGASFSLEGAGQKWRFLQTNTRLINIDKDFFAYIFTLKHNHNLGFTYLGGNDNVILLDTSFSIDFFLLSRLMNTINQPDFFQIQYSLNARSIISGNTKKDLDTLHKLSAGFNYKINDNSSVGISYSYQDGANPYTALEDQRFQTLSAKLKLVIE